MWRQNSSYAGFGSFGADLFSLKDSIYSLTDNYDYMGVADVMHWEGSLDFFCAMLDWIKSKAGEGLSPEREGKIKAYALGYLTHIIADTLFHPYVYRLSEDHWRFPQDKKKVAAHKKLESVLDSYMALKESGKDAFLFNYPEKILCFAGKGEKFLDEDIKELVSSGIQAVYKKILDRYAGKDQIGDYAHYFEKKRDLEKAEMHPLDDAYAKIISMLRMLYGMTLLKWIPVKMLKAVIPKKQLKLKHLKLLNLKNKNWYKVPGKSKLKYSAQELFDFSVALCREGIKLAMAYLESQSRDARGYFRKNAGQVFVLQENYNQDSGLPARYNEKKANQSRRKGKRFSFKLGEIAQAYKVCKKIQEKQERREQRQTKSLSLG